MNIQFPKDKTGVLSPDLQARIDQHFAQVSGSADWWAALGTLVDEASTATAEAVRTAKADHRQAIEATRDKLAAEGWTAATMPGFKVQRRKGRDEFETYVVASHPTVYAAAEKYRLASQFERALQDMHLAQRRGLAALEAST